MPIETVLRPILETVLDAVVVMDRDGVVRAWNGHAEATFGWSAEEATGRNLSELIVPPALREAHSRGLERFNQSGIARVLDRRLELTGIRRDGSEIPVELSITLVSRDGRDVFVGFMRDITERRRHEAQVDYQLRESRLMFGLSELMSREGSLEDALTAALDGICELADWPVGHAFLVEDDGRSLRSTAWSSGAHERARALVDATEALTFELGVGLPGRVLASGGPIWISQAEDDTGFIRRGLGFESGFAFPVLSATRIIAVLEFFSADPRQPENPVLLSAQAIGAQVGRVFERKRAEEFQRLLLAELNHRSKNILAVVQGMAHLTFGSATDLGEARRIFDQRLNSIAKANEILRGHSGQAALLGDIVATAIEGCGVDSRQVALSGPELCIDSSTAITVSLAVHELCTNGIKYGALSTPNGSVTLRWNVSATGDRFDLEWIETGGPPVTAPAKRGFGTRILERAIEAETGGKAEIRFDPAGLRYLLKAARHSGPPKPRAKAA